MSDERMPVGSMWKWKGGSGRSRMGGFTVLGHRNGATSIRCEDGEGSVAVTVFDIEHLLRESTRIGQVQTALYLLYAWGEEEDPALPEPEIRFQKLTDPGDLRVLALPPEPARAEEPACNQEPKCAPGCTPAAPCRTVGACPVFREEYVEECTKDSNPWRTYAGISPDWPPPAKRRAPPELRSAGLCIAGWNGREGLR